MKMWFCGIPAWEDDQPKPLCLPGYHPGVGLSICYAAFLPELCPVGADYDSCRGLFSSVDGVLLRLPLPRIPAPPLALRPTRSCRRGGTSVSSLLFAQLETWYERQRWRGWCGRAASVLSTVAGGLSFRNSREVTAFRSSGAPELRVHREGWRGQWR
jgi:hypothetical protein